MGLLPRPISFSIIIMFISNSLWLSGAIDCGGNSIAHTITVDQHGKRAFKTIQAAIDSIKNNNDQWVKIKINNGTYMEKVEIPLEKPCVIFKGADARSTIITYGDHQETDTSATFTSYPPNVVVSDITFKNSFNLGPLSKLHYMIEGIVKPAVAARVYGDKSYFLRCGFFGFQDTLFDVTGRHYFRDCYIQGEVDFIFGGAQSFYKNCVIDATQGNSKYPGFVTAQSRKSSNDPSGFVFWGGSIVGTGQVHLGRAWGPYSRVIFYKTHFSSVVIPQGWNAWNFPGHEDKFTYAEVNCTGPGADTANRVKWVKKVLTTSELENYSESSFINRDGWLANLPTIYL